MSAPQAIPVSAADSQSAPGLSFASNNPFRNRKTLTPSPANAEARPRMAYNNPFLDANEIFSSGGKGSTTVGSLPSGSVAQRPANGTKPTNVNATSDIFNDLSLLDQPRNGGPVSGHRAHISEDRRNNSRPRPRDPTGLDKSPAKHDRRPHRRASESSIMEKRPAVPRDDRERTRDRERSDRPPRTESEERRRRERRREREERHRKEKEQGGSSTRKDGKTRRPQGLDIIDKLDVTGVYGQGLFHHDGPFDACNPHRNSKRDRRAPMQAFPADSANMAIGGFGPTNARLDLDRFHGRGEEGFADYANTLRRRGPDTSIVDPTARIEPVHGEETSGLGTSTFLEGAPASRSALQQRRDSGEDAYGVPSAAAGGISRKKSLAQRIRGMSGAGGPGAGRGAFRSPEARYAAGDSPPRTGGGGKALSAGGVARAKYTKDNELNPFFEDDKTAAGDYDAAFEKKGAQIRVAERSLAADPPARPVTSAGPSSSQQAHHHVRAASFSRGGASLVRTTTADSFGADGARGSSSEAERNGGGGGGGGFLSRMKSMNRGARRQQKTEVA